MLYFMTVDKVGLLSGRLCHGMVTIGVTRRSADVSIDAFTISVWILPWLLLHLLLN